MAGKVTITDPRILAEAYTYLTGESTPPPAAWQPSDKEWKQIEEAAQIEGTLAATLLKKIETQNASSGVSGLFGRLAAGARGALGGVLGTTAPVPEVPAGGPVPAFDTSKIPTTADEFRAYVAANGPGTVHLFNGRPIIVLAGKEGQTALGAHFEETVFLFLDADNQLSLTHVNLAKPKYDGLQEIHQAARNGKKNVETVSFYFRHELPQFQDRPQPILLFKHPTGHFEPTSLNNFDGDKVLNGKVTLPTSSSHFNSMEINLSEQKLKLTDKKNQRGYIDLIPVSPPATIKASPTEGLKQFTQISPEWFDYVTTHFADHPDVFVVGDKRYIALKHKGRRTDYGIRLLTLIDGVLQVSNPFNEKPYSAADIADIEKNSGLKVTPENLDLDNKRRVFYQALKSIKAGQPEDLPYVSNFWNTLPDIESVGAISTRTILDGFVVTSKVSRGGALINEQTYKLDAALFTHRSTPATSPTPLDDITPPEGSMTGQEVYDWLNEFVQTNPYHPAVRFVNGVPIIIWLTYSVWKGGVPDKSTEVLILLHLYDGKVSTTTSKVVDIQNPSRLLDISKKVTRRQTLTSQEKNILFDPNNFTTLQANGALIENTTADGRKIKIGSYFKDRKYYLAGYLEKGEPLTGKAEAKLYDASASQEALTPQPIPAGKVDMLLFDTGRVVTNTSGDTAKLYESKIYPYGVLIGNTHTPPIASLYAVSDTPPSDAETFRRTHMFPRDAYPDGIHPPFELKTDGSVIVHLDGRIDFEKAEQHTFIYQQILTISEGRELYGPIIDLAGPTFEHIGPHLYSLTIVDPQNQKPLYKTNITFEPGTRHITHVEPYTDYETGGSYPVTVIKQNYKNTQLFLLSTLTPRGRLINGFLYTGGRWVMPGLFKTVLNDTTNWPLYAEQQKLDKAIKEFNHKQNDDAMPLTLQNNNTRDFVGIVATNAIKAKFGYKSFGIFLSAAQQGHAKTVEIIIGPNGTAHPYTVASTWEGKKGIFLIPNTAEGAMEGILEISTDGKSLIPQPNTLLYYILHYNTASGPKIKLTPQDNGLKIAVSNDSNLPDDVDPDVLLETKEILDSIGIPYTLTGPTPTVSNLNNWEMLIEYDKSNATHLQNLLFLIDNVLPTSVEMGQIVDGITFYTHTAERSLTLTAAFRDNPAGISMLSHKNTDNTFTVNEIKLLGEVPSFVSKNGDAISIPFTLAAGDTLQIAHQTSTHILKVDITFDGGKITPSDDRYFKREFSDTKELTLSNAKKLSLQTQFTRFLNEAGETIISIKDFTATMGGKEIAINKPASKIPQDGAYLLTLNTDDAFIEIEVTLKNGRPESVAEKLMKPAQVSLSADIVHSETSPAGQIEVDLKNTYDERGVIIAAAITGIRVRGTIHNLGPRFHGDDNLVGPHTFEIEHNTKEFTEIISITVDTKKKTLKMNPDDSLFEAIKVKVEPAKPQAPTPAAASPTVSPTPATAPVTTTTVPAPVTWTIEDILPMKGPNEYPILLLTDGSTFKGFVLTPRHLGAKGPLQRSTTRYLVAKAPNALEPTRAANKDILNPTDISDDRDELLKLLKKSKYPVNFDPTLHTYLEVLTQSSFDAAGNLNHHIIGFEGIARNSSFNTIPLLGVFLNTNQRRSIEEALKGAGDMGARSASGIIQTPSLPPSEHTLTELDLRAREIFLPTFETLDAITAHYNAVIEQTSRHRALDARSQGQIAGQARDDDALPPLDRLEFYSSDGQVISLPVKTVSRSTGPYNIVYDATRPIQTYVLGDREATLTEITDGPWIFNRGGYPLFFELKGEPGGKTKGRKDYEMHLGFYKDSYKDDEGTKALRTIFPYLANLLDEYGTKDDVDDIKAKALEKLGHHLLAYAENRGIATLPNVQFIPQQKVITEGDKIRLVFASPIKKGGYTKYTLSGFSYNRALGFLDFDNNLKLEIKVFDAQGHEIKAKAQNLILEHGLSKDDDDIILLQDKNDPKKKFTWNRARNLLIEGHLTSPEEWNHAKRLSLQRLMRAKGFYTTHVRGNIKHRAVGEKEAAYVAFETGGHQITTLPDDKQSFIYPTQNIKRLTTADDVALLFEELAMHDIDLHDEVLLPDEGSLLAQTQIGRDDEEFIFVGDNVVAKFLFEQENEHPYRYLLNPDANPILGLKHGEFLIKNPDRNADGSPKNGIEFYAIDASLMIPKRAGGFEREHIVVDIPATELTKRRQFELHRFGNTHVHSGRISFGFQIWDKGKTGEGAQAELIHWQKQLSVSREPDFADRQREPGDPLTLYTTDGKEQFKLHLNVVGFNGEGENCFIVHGIKFDEEGAYINYVDAEGIENKFRVYQMGSVDRSVLYLKDENDKWYMLMIGAQGQVWLWNSPRELREFLRPIRAKSFTNTGIREKYAATSKAYATRSLANDNATITLSLSQFTSASRGALASGSKPRVRLDISKIDDKWNATLSDILNEEQPTTPDHLNPAWPFNNNSDHTTVEIVEDTWTNPSRETEHGKVRVILKGEIKDADGNVTHRPYCVIVFKSAASILDGSSPLAIDYTHYHKDFKYVDSKLLPDDEKFLTERAGLPLEKETGTQEKIDWESIFLEHDPDLALLEGLITVVSETHNSYAAQAPLLSALHILSEKYLSLVGAGLALPSEEGAASSAPTWMITRDETGHFIYSDAVIASLAEYIKAQIPTPSSTPSGSGSSGRGAVRETAPSPKPMITTARIQAAVVRQSQAVAKPIPVIPAAPKGQFHEAGTQVVSDALVEEALVEDTGSISVAQDDSAERPGQYPIVPTSQQSLMNPTNPIVAALGFTTPWAVMAGPASILQSAVTMGAR